MRTKKILSRGLIIGLLLFVLFQIYRFGGVIPRKSESIIEFKDLPVELKDTLKVLYEIYQSRRLERKKNKGKTIGMPTGPFEGMDVISTDDNYTFRSVKWQPWTLYNRLNNTSNYRVWFLPFNTPKPVLIKDKYIYIHTDYNWLSSIALDSAKFYVHKSL